MRELVQEILDEEAGGEDDDDQDEEDDSGDDPATEKVLDRIKSLEEATVEESSKSSTDLHQLIESHASLDIAIKVKMLEEKHSQERKEDDIFISNLETDLHALNEASSPMSYSA